MFLLYYFMKYKLDRFDKLLQTGIYLYSKSWSWISNCIRERRFPLFIDMTN